MFGLLCLGALATAVEIWAVVRSSILVDPAGAWPWRGAFVGLFVAVGAYSWWRQPTSRLGPLLATGGFLYALTALNTSGRPLAYTAGMTAWAAYIVYSGYMYLCFPGGRLASRTERGLILGFAVSTAVLWALILALSPKLPAGLDFTDCGQGCPRNALQIGSGHAATGQALNTAYTIVSAIFAIGIAAFIFHKTTSSPHLLRRALEPLALVFIVSIAEFVIYTSLASRYPGTKEVLKLVNGMTTVSIPIAIVLGQVRGDVFAARRLGQIAVQAGGTPLTAQAVEAILADALGDPSLTLALWSPDGRRYVRSSGAPVAIPQDTLARGVVYIARNGSPVAALIHDPTLDNDINVVRGLAATSLMLLENTRLVEELQASRSRIVEAAEVERQRLERDLHDGAQQRLIAIQMRLAEARRMTDSAALTEQLDATSQLATEAVQELRALAHGIYPVVLQDEGPSAALRLLARSSLVPITLTDAGIARLPGRVEAAIYFCAREAIQNATKHAGAGAQITVTLAPLDDGVEFSIRDNGSGIPRDRISGMGIVGMRDRVEAVGGRLEIVSAPGEGTSVRGTIPGPQLTDHHGGERRPAS